MIENNSFKRQDICAIIEKCKDCGVSEFQMGQLKFSFNAREKVITDLPSPLKDNEGPKYNSLDITPEIQRDIDESNEDAKLEAELIEREYELSTMHIADPEGYEELVATGKIEELEQQIGEQYAELERRRA